MKKRFSILFLMIAICFLVPFYVGFVIYSGQFSDYLSDNANQKNVEAQNDVQDRIIESLDEKLQSNEDQNQDFVESNQSHNDLVEDQNLNTMNKSMEKPEVKETLMSLSEQLDDVNMSLQSDNQKEMVSLVQQSLNAYMNHEDSYKEDISKALNIYHKLTMEEQKQVQSTILTNVSVSELLFLKKTFGF